MSMTITKTQAKLIASAEAFVGLTLDEMTAFYTGNVCKTFAALVERNAKTGYVPKHKQDGRKRRAFNKVCKAFGIQCARLFAVAA